MWGWVEGPDISQVMKFELVLTSVKASLKERSPSVVKSSRELKNKLSTTKANTTSCTWAPP